MNQTPHRTEREGTNRLIDSNSPYLLSHAHNPVDWHPWDDEALGRAQREDKPIFLSIGYAACHWCHVMERESFMNEEIAAILNRHFICVKVDREERPDLDQIYMAFTTALTGHGGWPMSVFLTPGLKPFFAGTYFPPEDHHGRPGFRRVLLEIAGAYTEDKPTLLESSERIFRQITSRLPATAPPALLNLGMISRSVRALMQSFDHVNGGFGTAPKFPHALELSLFLRHFHATGETGYLEAADLALTRMAQGGIYDHLGGGFARYATDASWLVPHFEKMLYDNALLVPVYAEAFQITHRRAYLAVVQETLDFMLREFGDSSGGFYSALDADSEGEEGKYYLWDKREIDSLLGDEAQWFCRYYNVTETGNFEGKNILHVDASSERTPQEADVEDLDRRLARCKRVLVEARSRRARPLTDDKILASWNGMALSAVCRGYQLTGHQRYLDASIRNASFIRDELYRDGVLRHSYRAGRATPGEFLEDYAFVIRGLLDLYETDHSANYRWLQLVIELADRATELFLGDNGGFYLRPEGQSDLIMRPQDETDGSIPAAGSIMIGNLFKLNRLTGHTRYLSDAEKGMRAVSGRIERYPAAMTSAVLALDYLLDDKVEIVIVGSGGERDRMLHELYQRYIPNRTIAISSDGSQPIALFEERSSSAAAATAYVCRNSVCRLPATSLEEFKQQLDRI